MTDIEKIQADNLFKILTGDLGDYITILKTDNEIKEKLLSEAYWLNNYSLNDCLLVFENIERFKFLVEDNLSSFRDLHLVYDTDIPMSVEFLSRVFKCDDQISLLKQENRENRLKKLLE